MKDSKNLAVVELGKDSTHQLKDLIMSALPKGGNLNSCTACGACASGCPASGMSGMDPRKLVRLVSLGQDEDIMTNDWVWMCTTCNRCVYVCPMQIDIPGMVMTIRNHWPSEKKPDGLKSLCREAFNTETGSALGVDAEDWQFIVEEMADEVREQQPGFEKLNVPVDKKGAHIFLNQNSQMPVREPEEMPPLWKILHLAGADWTYGTTGWAAENYCMFLSDKDGWEHLVRSKAVAVEELGCRVLVNTECGHDFSAVKQGLERFDIPHSFEVNSIIEYYADWIRTGRLKVNSDWNDDLKIKFTVQDPCQLVRKGEGDRMAEKLRFVVEEAVGRENFIDMYPNRSNNYCCGGGGGAIETDFESERLQYGKIKVDQILETGADYCITPCNNCHSQIWASGRFYEADFKTVHLWTILCLSLGVLGEKERKYLGRDLKGVGK